MNINGTQKTQLTNRLGYDGGAFFNMDTTKIVWRVYHPESDNEIADYLALLDQNLIRQRALQTWTMNADGTKKQVTKNKATNFGPYFFPDGNRIIFSSNLHDQNGRDFDLYVINSDGSDLELITFLKVLMHFQCLILMENIWSLHQIGTRKKEEILIYL